MESRIIKKEIKQIFITNGRLLQKIADKRQRHFGSVYRWFNTDSDELLHIDVLDIIKKETGLSDNEIFENAKEVLHE